MFALSSSFRTPDCVMGRAKLLEQFVFAWYYGISCAWLLFHCVLKCAHIASKMSAPYASKWTIKMGLKELKLFPMEQISVTKIQGCTNSRQSCSRVNAAVGEPGVFCVLHGLWILGTSNKKEPIQGAQVLHHGQDWTAAQPVYALVWPGPAWSDNTSRYVLQDLHPLLTYLD